MSSSAMNLFESIKLATWANPSLQHPALELRQFQTSSEEGNSNYDSISVPKHKQSNHSISRDQLTQLLEENDKLTSQLKEVIKMNTHWQRYDSQREEHVQKLTKTIQDLNKRISDLESQLQESTEDHHSGNGDVKPRDLMGPDETSSSFHEQEERISRLTRDVQQLKEKNKALEDSNTTRPKGHHKEDELAILREQINVCVEDFKHERRDRERIHAENEKLKERLAQSEARIMSNEEQVFVYQEQIKRLQERLRHQQPPAAKPRSGYDEPCCYPEDRPRQLIAPSQPRYVPRPHHYGNDLTDLPQDVEIDGDFGDDDQTDGKKSSYTMNIPMEPTQKSSHRNVDEEPLECPRCLASYPISRHADLLTHINKCMM